MKWKMPYNAGFDKWINETFSNSKLKTNNELFEHQTFVKHYMQDDSPFHGLLLYHGLGVGKTRSAIEIAKENNRDVVVLLPASLKQNFLGEIVKTKNTDKIAFDFVNYNGISRKNLKDFTDTNFFDNKIVIIDEVHNFISRANGNGYLCKQLYQILMDSKNLKIIALSGTPLINKPIEIGSMLNLLNGYIYYNVYKYIGFADFKALENAIMDNHRIASCFIDTELRTISITYFPDGFIRNSDGYIVRKGETIKGDDENIEKLLKKFKLKLRSSVSKKKTTLLPLKEEVFDDFFIDYQSFDLKNKLLFSRRICGLVSYFESYDIKDFPTQNPQKIVKVPMQKDHFGKYLEERLQEIERERKASMVSKIAKDKDEIKNGNVYRSFSRAVCNFAFPPNIKRPYPSTIKYDIEDNVYDANVDLSKEYKKKYEIQIAKALQKLQDGADKYLSMDGLENHGPKMRAIISNLQKCQGPALVYSSFRNVEGLAIFGMALKQTMGCEELTVKKKKGKNGEWHLICNDFKANKYIVFSDKTDETKILLNIFNSEFTSLPPSIQSQLSNLKVKTNLHGEFVKVLMITQSGAEGISLKNVRQVHEMESHWNNIRSKQVRGRAIRAKSHVDLPANERNVDTFLYMTELTEDQKQNNLIKSNDNDLTSDEYVYEVAMKKERINNKLLEIIQSTAVDCMINKEAHKKKQIKCFKSPVGPNNYTYYLGDISKDVLDKSIVRIVKTKKEYKSSKLMYNGVELLVLENPSKEEKNKILEFFNETFNRHDTDLDMKAIFRKDDLSFDGIIGFTKGKKAAWLPSINVSEIQKIKS